MPTLLSVNVGLPRMIKRNGRAILSAIWKTSRKGRVWASRLGLEGDGVADFVGHGGEVRAVLVYQMASYEYWNRILKRDGFEYGQFGENLTVEGLADDEVCIGDRYQIGTAVFEVSQPRVTCFKLGMRLNSPGLAGLLVAHGKPGFYMRVVHEGEIGEGDAIVKIASGNEQMTVTEIDGLLYKNDRPIDKLTRALKISALSPGWKGSFRELLNAQRDGVTTGNAGLRQSRDSKEWVGFRPLRIIAIHQESDDVKSFELGTLDDSLLPSPKPGQHIAIKFIGPGKRYATRFYSISGGLKSGRYRISIKREHDGSASAYLHHWATIGAVLEVSAPQGQFTLEDGQRPIVLLSGGIGVTPMVSMLHSLVDGKPREVWWLHSARDGKHHPFQSEVQDLLKSIPGGKSHIVYTRPLDADRLPTFSQSVGRFDSRLLRTLALPVDADFYVCGPAGFLSAMQHLLGQLGIIASRIHTESFGSRASVIAGTKSTLEAIDASADAVAEGALVTFARSGLVVSWSERFASLLDLAEACNVPTQWSCRSGVCHSCQTNVLEGQFTYGPEPLSPPAMGTALICCAKPSGNVELDL
ncbi:MOSC and FAD-binding oxidoreductase domain-containing protein [Duganella callida]|uniref:MOSC domain-containing protein n=1 Tax=Duganella callida TaxID=2561932 RepID=A0A4Y9SFB0_9BURK|nr:MOSC and FAD-binding oxidoreductase domain-containing protein [Duganella callida]TFW18644.1 MOSC domain-containing protein [Duganella callida]